MCGIAGIISPTPSLLNTTVLKAMAQSLVHRGPDGEGVWINEENTAGFAHRRLSIIDLSAEASQPMHFLNRYTIVFNGEIYNYIELRIALEKVGYHFKTKSDTEVILAAYDHYKEKCVQHFDGMFAFALWDDKEKRLFAARDCFGEKPFYYCTQEDTFVFGSEMKALWAAGVHKSIENNMLLNYITLGQLQDPEHKSKTFYNDIYSLPPAHYLNFYQGKLSVKQYWNLDKETCININEEDAISELDRLLNKAVTVRMRSDVAIGSSLSGGLDSSTLLYYIKKNQKENISGYNTFSALFPGFEKDESRYVQKISQAFDVSNKSTTPSASSLIEDFEKLMYHQEEPFSSSSVYAQYKVMQLAQENNVKVLIDGQGADEVFAGYHKYIHWYLQEKLNRRHLFQVIDELKKFRANGITVEWGIKNILAAYLPSHVSLALEKRDFAKISHNKDISKFLLSHHKGREWEGIHKPIVTKMNDILYFNTMKSGLEELLRFSDRNSMAHGCEVRLPFLNKELVQFVFSLPSSMKMQNGFTKHILRKLMNGKLSDDIVWRKDKVGYEPPQKSWMETPMMKDYLYEAKKKLVKNDIITPEALQRKYKPLAAHERNNYDWRYMCVAEMI